MGEGKGPRANALRRELTVATEAESTAPPEGVYDVLVDLAGHPSWINGEEPGLLSIDAPDGPATVGTEFSSAGQDRMSRMRDTSVVTEATRPRVFEFVTESSMELTKSKAVSDWTYVHRFELTPTEKGCRVRQTDRIVRASALPGILKVFRVPGLRSIVLRMAASMSRASLHRLASAAEQRVTAR
jgi:hypothetical protein